MTAKWRFYFNELLLIRFLVFSRGWMKEFIILCTLLVLGFASNAIGRETLSEENSLSLAQPCEISRPVVKLTSEVIPDIKAGNDSVGDINSGSEGLKLESFETVPPLASSTPPPYDLNLPSDVIKHSKSPSDSGDADSLSQDLKTDSNFDWSAAINQTLVFLGVQHGYAITQPKTRTALKGPFFKDYFKSVKSLHGWGDGGRFFTNYIAHPLEGSFLGYLQVQNDPKGKGAPFSGSKVYWKSRAKALAWSSVWSTQFEIGPISQASIGNVGLDGKQTYVDIVITPTVGMAFLIAEDILDKYLIRRIERMTGNYFVRIFSRMLLNPTRTMANLLRLETPWHRDKGLR